MGALDSARMAPSPADGQIVGRARELAEIEAFLDAVDALPAAIALVGEAGIGKTTVWSWSLQAAAARGYRCLRSRPAEVEADLAFTALGDLLAGEFASVAGLLPERQRRALEAALLIDDLDSGAIEPRAVGVAALSALRMMSADRPLLVAIDDVQWVDRASVAALGFALRRLTTEPVGFLSARRATSAGSTTSIETRLPTATIQLAGLSLGALHAIVTAQLGRSLPRPQLRRLHELSRGNPLLASELLRAASAGHMKLDEPSAGIPDLERLLGARLGVLPPTTRRLLLIAAAAPRPTVALLEAAAGLRARQRLAPAVSAGIVELTESEVRFSHPLLASMAYGAPEDERRAVHAQLAELTIDPDERARHLALAASQPDEAVAAAMEGAAGTVFRRGAPAIAAQLAHMSVRLTPVERAADRQRRARLNAEYLFAAGDTAAAASVLEGLLDGAAGDERARLLALLARIRHFMDDLEQGSELNRQALAALSSDDELRSSIHEGLAWGLLLTRGDLRLAARHARSAVRAARSAGSDVALAEALAVQGLTALAIGQPAGPPIDQAIRLEPAVLHLRVLRHPSFARAYVLSCIDRLAEARSVYEELAARAEGSGDESAPPPINVHVSLVELLSGAWPDAEAHARVGLELAEQTGQLPSQAALLSRLALLAAWRGRADEAQALAWRALRLAGAADDSRAGIARALTRGGEVAAWALGAVALARDRPRDALDYLEPLAEALLGAGMREPGELRFLPDLVEALVGEGRTESAVALVAEMESMAAATGRTTAAGIAARCRALVEAERGRQEDALSQAATAVRLLAGGPLPLEEGRALLVLGTLQRRARRRRDARTSLSAASGMFDELGAHGWAARARGELARVGGRTASGDVLTPTESRVADLVADGMANKEVAAALGISTKTVELHLSRVYAKLDVGSRTELVRLLTAGKG